MGVGLEIGTSDVLGNEASENRSGRLSKDRRYSQCHWRQWITCVGLQMDGILTDLDS